MTVTQAAEQYDVKARSLRARLDRDMKAGRNLYGSRRVGSVWIVTSDYMKNWKDGREK